MQQKHSNVRNEYTELTSEYLICIQVSFTTYHSWRTRLPDSGCNSTLDRSVLTQSQKHIGLPGVSLSADYEGVLHNCHYYMHFHLIVIFRWTLVSQLSLRSSIRSGTEPRALVEQYV